jgi:formylglycine-generating enzyme required for sulfatase activity
MTVELGKGVTMKLMRIPTGKFVMGDADGQPDEHPLAVVSINRDFWIGACEVTNAQFRCFDPEHRPGYFMKRYPGGDGPGLALDGTDQPAVRVSWDQAMGFCRWLSEKTGRRFTLPTEAQWEYACRAGTASPGSYGPLDADFSAYANVADRSLAGTPSVTGGLTSSITASKITGIMQAVVYGGDIPCIETFDDKSVATADVGRYRPNAWGLHDMHGNVAEWTLSGYRPYPYVDNDGRNTNSPAGRKVVRGGSWVDRPKRCRSAFRLGYPAWQRVHNVGFRVVCEEPVGVVPK